VEDRAREGTRSGVHTVEHQSVKGQEIALVVKHGWVATGSHWHALKDERSEVLRVSERAHTLMLYCGAEELLRLPLKLELGELNIVRP